MYNQLKFVQGAVAKKDYNPILTHFFIDKERVTGYNGRLTLSSPIELNLTAMPKAVPFVKAIETCKDAISIHMTPAKRLAIKSGPFKTFVECLPEEDAFTLPPQVTGKAYPVNGEFIELLKQLQPFVGVDASRMWTNSILFSTDGCVFATNNIVFIQRYVGAMLPVERPLCIPYDVINELLRIKENPLTVSFDDRGILFAFEGDRWMHTSLRINEWPIEAETLFKDEDPHYPPLNPGIFEALHKLKPFVDMDSLFYFHNGAVCTHKEDGMGTAISVEGAPDLARFNISQFLLLEGVATHFDFSAWPNTCKFYGPLLRGAMSGALE